MKKRVIYFLIMGCLLLAGCRSRTEEQPVKETAYIEETVTKATLEDYLSKLHLLESPIREYGEEAGYIQMEDDLVVRILYPESDTEALNTSIEEWLSETVAYYQEESAGSGKLGESAELTGEYDSYLVNDEIVSVKMTGFYDRPYLAHPVDMIKTFHVNIKTGALLNLEDVLLPNGLNLLREKVISDASIPKEAADEQLLDLWTLTNDGLEIILERGDYLPMSEGTVTLLYNYEDITDIVSFCKETEEEKPEIQAVFAQESANTHNTAIDPEKPMIALTFDDGPNKYTARLLDTFAAYGGKGTFFVIGNLLDDRADVIQRMALEGHEIAGHSWSHRQLTKLSTEELTDQLMNTRAKIYEITGVDSTLIRPPYGSYNDQVKTVCANLGISMANWSMDTLDWKYKDADRIYNTILNDVKDGDIILCHDLYGTTVAAMERVIPDLIAKGYQLVTVSELISYGEKEIIPGNVYRKQ